MTDWTLALGPVAHRARRTVRRLRENRALTLAQLGREVGLDVPTLSKIELGYRRMSLDDLVALARALGVSPGYVLLGAEEDPELSTGTSRDQAPPGPTREAPPDRITGTE